MAQFRVTLAMEEHTSWAADIVVEADSQDAVRSAVEQAIDNGGGVRRRVLGGDR